MADDRQVIAVAGAGHLGRYVCEELLASPDFRPVVLTRSTTTDTTWFASKNIPTYPTDYTPASILSILNNTSATTLISFINLASNAYITIHAALLQACQESHRCKRLIPSEWIGNIDDYPLKPAFYGTTREPFRQMLRAQNSVRWTLVHPGWLADYFLPAAKTYMKPIPHEFPVDPNGWRVCVRGSGEEEQSWTCGRDVGRAVVALCRVKEEWEPVTYVAGEWSTFNAAVKVMEKFYDRPLPRTEKPWSEIQKVLEAHAGDEELAEEAELAQVEELMVMGYMSVPKEKTLRQRGKFFAGVGFRDLQHLLHDAQGVDFI
ncbi:MAG: hypothetical protein L6R36_005939 [Xanthoria steineri]|nr:MAG: hypothetical protein L6R36_005939 [Xanthoria steineri]